MHRIWVENIPHIRGRDTPPLEEMLRHLLKGSRDPMEQGFSKELKFAQQNLHRSIAATNELNFWDVDVALVQEPNISKRSKLHLLRAPKRSYCAKQARAAVVIGETLD